MTLEPSILREPNGRRSRNRGVGAGRPEGSSNRGSTKTATRLRVRLHRERKRELAEEAESQEAEHENFLKWQRGKNLVFMGEISPGQNCLTAAEELEVASEFASAMQIDPIGVGETIRAFVNRVLRRWCEIGTPLFCRATKAFGETVEQPDPKRIDARAELIKAYDFPDGCDETPLQPPELTTNV